MRQFFKIVSTEFVTIFRDGGVMLILFGAMLIYGTLYPLIYAPEVVRNIPVAVVDLDNTPSSRHLVRMLDATPEARVEYSAQSLPEAEQLFMLRRVYGIIYIPADYEKNLNSSLQNHVSLYADGGYFLLYSNFLNAVSGVVQQAGAEVQLRTLMQSGMTEKQAEWIASPVDYQVNVVFNPYDGYATALMPAVMILIVQQLLLIGIGMVGGTWYERGIWAQFRRYSATRLVFAKAAAYLLLYIPMTFFFFTFQYKLFGYPMRGNGWELAWIMLPYLLSNIFLGLTIGAIVRHRESSFMGLITSSVFFLMISGISWPRQGMPEWLYGLGQLVPSSSGIEALVKIRTMGAPLQAVSEQAAILWILTGIYGLTAVLATLRRVRALRREINDATEPDRDRGLPMDDSAEYAAWPDKSL